MNKEYIFQRVDTPQIIKSEKKFLQPALSSLKHKNPFVPTDSHSPSRFHTYCNTPLQIEKPKRPPFVPKLDTSSLLHNRTEQNSSRALGSESGRGGDSSSRFQNPNRVTKSARLGINNQSTSPLINQKLVKVMKEEGAKKYKQFFPQKQKIITPKTYAMLATPSGAASLIQVTRGTPLMRSVSPSAQRKVVKNAKPRKQKSLKKKEDTSANVSSKFSISQKLKAIQELSLMSQSMESAIGASGQASYKQSRNISELLDEKEDRILMRMAPSEQLEKPPNKPSDSDRHNESKLSKTRQEYKNMSKIGSLNNSSLVSALDTYMTNKSARGTRPLNYSKPSPSGAIQLSHYESKYKNALLAKESAPQKAQKSGNISLLHASIKNLKEAARKNLRAVKSQKQPSTKRFNELARNLTKRADEPTPTSQRNTSRSNLTERTMPSARGLTPRDLPLNSDLRSFQNFSNTVDSKLQDFKRAKKTPISKKSQQLFKNIAHANDPATNKKAYKGKIKTVHLSGNYDLNTRAITTKASSPIDQRYTLGSDVDQNLSLITLTTSRRGVSQKPSKTYSDLSQFTAKRLHEQQTKKQHQHKQFDPDQKEILSGRQSFGVMNLPFKELAYGKIAHSKTLSIPDPRLMTTTSHIRSNTSQILEKYKKIAKRLSPHERLYRKTSKSLRNAQIK